MENAEEVFQFLEEFSKRKPKIIPQELNDYLEYVARTGDPVYQWSLVKSLFKEKLLNVITDFHESTPSVDIPPCPNVDPFNYDIMKNSLIERLDSFTSAPFTVQRICELLTCPRKQYNRVDKFMRAIEKNILVVSTREPGPQRHQEPENGEAMEPMVNGSDNNSEYNVDVEMEDISWKENAESRQESEPQPSSSDAHISVDDLEARLQAKQNESSTQDKQTTEYESVTPPELNVVENNEEPLQEEKSEEIHSPPLSDEKENNTVIVTEKNQEQKIDVEMNEASTPPGPLVIPDIKVDDAEMTEQKLHEQAQAADNIEPIKTTNEVVEGNSIIDEKSTDESSSDASTKDENEPKNISEASSSSEESSSSSDNVDGNSNSPKSQTEVTPEKQVSQDDKENNDSENATSEVIDTPAVTIQSENYSITDVNSEIPQAPTDIANKEEQVTPESSQEDLKEEIKKDVTEIDNETKTETPSS
ncbi:unnamed protein product [Colias eurytheme]|nr:unnamed protein product [Colias eurytheme]